MNIPQINIDEFDYQLPADKIAKYPIENRDQSKLLVYDNYVISEQLFSNLADFLPTNTLLVFNNTKVIRARLHFYKSTGAHIEIFCLEPYNAQTTELSFQQTHEVEWHCLVGNQKKWKKGTIAKNIEIDGSVITVEATIVKKLTDGVVVKFTWNGLKSFAAIMEAMGQTPIPPYLEREAEEIDTERYQTVYSKHKGSVAAPTAGLHFSPEVLQKLKEKGVQTIELTLHVGAGTFKPVKSETIDGHEMHTEHFSVPIETLRTIYQHKGPIIAVGTTTVRTLESLYLCGIKMNKGVPFKHISQWDGFQYVSNMSRTSSLEAIVHHLEKEKQHTFEASTAIIIVPGFKFQVIKGLVTNFHQPRSTLLLLVSALIGEKWKAIYQFAKDYNFRFLSYGDSSLLLP
jgi:S-adenosylmethionine:tRNA ribosyltransferase-isomerase